MKNVHADTVVSYNNGCLW